MTGRWHYTITMPDGQRVTADYREQVTMVIHRVASAWSDGRDAEPSDLAAIMQFAADNRQTMIECQEGRCPHHVV